MIILFWNFSVRIFSSENHFRSHRFRTCAFWTLITLTLKTAKIQIMKTIPRLFLFICFYYLSILIRLYWCFFFSVAFVRFSLNSVAIFFNNAIYTPSSYSKCKNRCKSIILISNRCWMDVAAHLAGVISSRFMSIDTFLRYAYSFFQFCFAKKSFE